MVETKVNYTVPYDQGVADFIERANGIGNISHVPWKKKSVTLHSNEGNLTHEGALLAWRSRGILNHFDIDVYGRIAQTAIVNEYAWAVGNNEGNKESIHIDMANKSSAPKWIISEDTLRSAARLIGWLFVYEIDDHPSRNNIFLHDHWGRQVGCPGPYMTEVFDQFLSEIQGWYESFRIAQNKPPDNFEIRVESAADEMQIKTIQTTLGIEVTGVWDNDMDQAVLEFRRKHLRR